MRCRGGVAICGLATTRFGAGRRLTCAEEDRLDMLLSFGRFNGDEAGTAGAHACADGFDAHRTCSSNHSFRRLLCQVSSQSTGVMLLRCFDRRRIFTVDHAERQSLGNLD